ncbi:hypothetical protein TRFO_25878 [Tritrichomonas foetus]|uniref:Uncharacterized protein n=1 Tax=Tritrichomonas foetus TaxID=1144522 RepID=A0A1J4K5M5_9EUKA|nr:hypothetical protein TRFO_25878 [Tritrichomonas foetus]|eukprot:OHT06176.1 hypothetical protein TRFO_25878 [Tritrichomonas foetus]
MNMKISTTSKAKAMSCDPPTTDNSNLRATTDDLLLVRQTKNENPPNFSKNRFKKPPEEKKCGNNDAHEACPNACFNSCFKIDPSKIGFEIRRPGPPKLPSEAYLNLVKRLHSIQSDQNFMTPPKIIGKAAIVCNDTFVKK